MGIKHIANSRDVRTGGTWRGHLKRRAALKCWSVCQWDTGTWHRVTRDQHWPSALRLMSVILRLVLTHLVRG